MTEVAQIITDALRQSNLLAINSSPSGEQNAEGLRYLNRILKSVFGNEVGDPLTSFPIGRDHISRPSGYPWWDTVPDNDWFVPKNTRVMLNLEQSVNLYLHPAPDDGSRFAAIDVSNNLATYPVTVYGNGNYIEGNFTISLDENGFDAEWVYRADIGTWVKYAPIDTFDIFPFPEEFDDFFISMLAMHLNPAYGAAMDNQSQAVLARSRSQLRARYTQDIPVRSELGLIRPARVAADRDLWGNSYWLYQPSAIFDKGWPF